MNVSAMRFVDRWAGVPACWFLTRLRRCGDLLRRLVGSQPGEIRSILFVKLAEQGATVLTYAALKKAIDRVGRENVYFLVFEPNRFILDVMDVIPRENVIAIATKSIAAMPAGMIRAIWRMRRLKIDAAIDFEFFARGSAALTYLSGAKIRSGLHSFTGDGPYRGDLMTHRLVYNPHLHTSQTFQVLVDALDADPAKLPSLDMPAPEIQKAPPAYKPSEDELSRFRAVIESAAGTSEYSPLVLLNANASDLLPLRRWPAERYVELARLLLERNDKLHVAFTGAPDEADSAAALVAEIGSDRCFSLAGKTSMSDLLTLYCLADLMVTNDSGPALFATMTPMQVVTLFGPETPKLFGGSTERSHIVYQNLPCSPCVNAYNNRLSPCQNNVCMQRTTVDEVFDRICRVCNL